jgi:hypothetical protein
MIRVLLPAFLLAAATLAQDPRGAISGRVTDSSSAVMPGVEVRAVNRDTGVAASAATNPSGNYQIPFLLPGFYTLSAEAAGFKKYLRENVEVRVSETVEVNLSLELGAVAETIQVTAESPLMVTTDASQGTVVDEKRIMELPLVGGNPIELALLDPAIMNETDLRERRASMTNASSQWSTMGSSAFTNEFQIDGVSNTFAEGNSRARVAFNPPSSAIGQFKIMVNPFDAAVGNTMGAVVNVSTKAGTNRLTGELHWYARNRVFDCNDFFNNKNGTVRPVYQDNRMGFSLGGPVTIPRFYKGRNRTFWFYTWEWNPYTVPASFTGTVPTAPQRQGDFSALLPLGTRYQIYDPYSTRPAPNNRFQRDPFPENVIPSARFNPTGLALANLYPLPTRAGNADGINNYYNGSSSAKALEDYQVHLARFDHAFSESHRLFFRIHYDNWTEKKNRYYDNGIQGMNLGRVNRGLALDDVLLLTPSLVLNIRYGITQQDFTEYRETRGIDLSKFGFSPRLLSMIEPQRATLPRVNPDTYSDYSTWEKGDGANTSLTHNFNFTFTTQRANHSLHLGGDVRAYRAFQNRYPYETSPNLVFSSTYTRGPLDSAGASPIGQDLASMLMGISTGSMMRSSSFALQNLFYGFFVQDDVKVSRRLTVNIGLRYELEAPLTERYDRLNAGFAFDTVSPVETVARANYAKNPVAELPLENFRVRGGLEFSGVGGLPRSPFRGEKNNFMPRIGLAWQLFPSTTVRAGYGIFFGTIGVNGTTPLQYGFEQSTPIQPTLDNGQSYRALVNDPFPNGLLSPAGASGGLTTYLSQAISVSDPVRLQPYSQRWSLSVQQVLPGQILVETSYVGSRGTRVGITRALSPTPREFLSTSPTRDQAAINLLTAAIPNPFYGLGYFYTPTTTRANLLRPYPQFTSVSRIEPAGFSWYHGMQIRAARRLYRGVTLNVGYAWQKLMEGMSFLNETDPVPYETLSASHRPHRLTLNGIWEIPVGRRKLFFPKMSTPLNAVFGNWQLSGIVTRQAGPPLLWGNIIFAGDPDSIAIPRSERTVERWFNVDAGFNRVSNQALSQNIRSFPMRLASIQADGQSRWDLSLTKRFRLAERRTAQFRAQCFNIMNHANFGAPNVSPASTAFGTITSTAGLPRTWQFSLGVNF